MSDQTLIKTPKLHFVVSGRKWARVAH